MSCLYPYRVNRYLASKYHYFGVGGGVESFQDFVVNLGVFSVKQVLTTDESKPIDPLMMTFKTLLEDTRNISHLLQLLYYILPPILNQTP